MLVTRGAIGGVMGVVALITFKILYFIAWIFIKLG
jgi:hypothetical protein